jgi:hypothetical protein
MSTLWQNNEFWINATCPSWLVPRFVNKKYSSWVETILAEDLLDLSITYINNYYFL